MFDNLKNLFLEGFSTFSVRAFGVVFSFGLTTLLANVLTTENMGTYAFILSISTLASILAMFGLPQLTLRETAKNIATKRWRVVKGIWIFSTGTIFANSLFLICVLSLFQHSLFGAIRDQAGIVFYSLFFIPLASLLRLAVCILGGMKLVQVGQFLECILYPILIALVLVLILITRGQVDAKSVMQANVIALIVIVLPLFFLIYRLSPPEENKKDRRNYAGQCAYPCRCG